VAAVGQGVGPSRSAGWVRGRVEDWAEFASGETIEGAEAVVEFGAGEAALAIEEAEEVGGGRGAFSGIAFNAARDQVAVGVGAQADSGHDVIEALHAGSERAEAVEAAAALAGVDGAAKHLVLQEIDGVQRERLGAIAGAKEVGSRRSTPCNSAANLAW